MSSQSIVARAIPIEIRPGSQLDIFIRNFTNNKVAMIGVGMTLFYFLLTLFGPMIATHDPHAINHADIMEPPSREYWFGTDSSGRDVFARVMAGARVSLVVGLSTVAFATAMGVFFGVIAGYVGGYTDEVIMRSADVLFAFPGILLALVIVATIGTGLSRVILALGIVYGIGMARISRGSALSVREMEYVMAARSYGERAHNIMFKEMLPNMLSAVLVQSTLIFAFAILAEASLSYLGLSADAPTVTWGIMVSDGQSTVNTAPWMTFFPGFAILFSVLGFTLIGVGLRDALDPKLDDDDTEVGGSSI